MIPRLVLVLPENWALLPGALPREALAATAKWAREVEAAGFDGIMAGEGVRLGQPSQTLRASHALRTRQTLRTPATGPGSSSVGQAASGRLEPSGHAASDGTADGTGTSTEPGPRPSALSQLAAIAGCTERIRLLASTIITADDHPVLLAKDFATLDALSNGRLVVQPIPHLDVPVPPSERQRWLDEILEVWELTWNACSAGKAVAYHGRYFSFDDVMVTPGPMRENGPPLWLGPDALHPRMIRRLVRFASGYAPLGRPSPSALVQLADAMDTAGRPGTSLELVATIQSPSRDAVGTGDLTAALANLPQLVSQGFGTFCIKPSQFLDDPNDIGEFCREVVVRMAHLLR